MARIDPLPSRNRGSDEHWMGLAMEQARLALSDDEVPIGAVLVLDGECIGADRNRTRASGRPTAHAELLVLEAAFASHGARLVGATLYSTLEPCFMCAGALIHARVARVVWGARDPKFGGCASIGRVLEDPRLNHRVEVAEGVRSQEAIDLLQSFFRSKRSNSPSSVPPHPEGPAPGR